MSMFRTENPTLKETTFVRATSRTESVMTLQGTVNKTGIALLILTISAAVAWNHVFGAAMIMPTMWTGLIGGLVLSLVTVFKTQWAPVTTPLYAVFEGLFIGTISLLFNVRYPGIALNAAALTLAILAALLLAYRSGWILPSENVKLGIAAATGGIALVYLVGMGLSFFGVLSARPQVVADRL